MPSYPKELLEKADQDYFDIISRIPNAKDSNLKSNKNMASKDLQILESFIKLINKATNNGEYSFYVNGSITKQVKGILESKGYTVRIENQYNETITCVSWAKA